MHNDLIFISLLTKPNLSGVNILLISILFIVIGFLEQENLFFSISLPPNFKNYLYISYIKLEENVF